MQFVAHHCVPVAQGWGIPPSEQSLRLQEIVDAIEASSNMMTALEVRFVRCDCGCICGVVGPSRPVC